MDRLSDLVRELLLFLLGLRIIGLCKGVFNFLEIHIEILLKCNNAYNLL